MIIKNKADIETFKLTFILFSDWDGKKYYITVPDTKFDGTVTFIQYPNGDFTFYRKNTSYWYLKEHRLNNLDMWHIRIENH